MAENPPDNSAQPTGDAAVPGSPAGVSHRVKATHFHHHASAIGFSGRITHPFQHVIDAQGSCAVPPLGGYAANRSDDFRFKDIVSFGSCYSSVTSTYSEKDGAFFTVATATVEDLDILGVVKIAKLVGRVMCRHEYHDPGSTQEPREPSIIPLGSTYTGLEIAGHVVPVKTFTGALCEHDTYSGLLGGSHRIPIQKPTHANGAIRFSIVESVETNGAPELKMTDGHRIELKHFGTITLGECVAGRRSKALTMLRVDLGCGTEGQFIASTPQGNGSPPSHVA